jgi:hypothetical protein
LVRLQGARTQPLDPPAGSGTRWAGLARRLAAPVSELDIRFTLFAVALTLQNALEFPRNIIQNALGKGLTSVLVFLALGCSLALLLVALASTVPSWRWLRSRKLQVALLVLVLAAVPTGLGQLGKSVAAGFQAPSYPNDGTTLDHYAARQLLDGHNPYVTSDIVAANRALGQDATHTTPLRCGAFGGFAPTQYPTNAQLRQAFATEPINQPNKDCAFESHVSYPALAFLPLVPFVWAGFPSVVIFFALCYLALVALVLKSLPRPLRPWLLLFAIADTPLLDAVAGGVLDVFYILLLFVAWRWLRRPVLSAVFLGLALAAKQLAWFFLPFYAILVWRRYGWRQAAARLAGAGALFLAINLPFMLNDLHAWTAGILAPEVDKMFPLGNGLILLARIGLMPLLPSAAYTALEILTIAVCLVWYWRNCERMPEAGFVLAVLPLFFAWRSLTTYFYFVALPALALLLARYWHSGEHRYRLSSAGITPALMDGAPPDPASSPEARPEWRP